MVEIWATIQVFEFVLSLIAVIVGIIWIILMYYWNR